MLGRVWSAEGREEGSTSASHLGVDGVPVEWDWPGSAIKAVNQGEKIGLGGH